jgi:hypothetical protein
MTVAGEWTANMSFVLTDARDGLTEVLLMSAGEVSYQTSSPDHLLHYATNVAGWLMLVAVGGGLALGAFGPTAFVISCGIAGLVWGVVSLDVAIGISISGSGEIRVRCLYWTKSYPPGTACRWRRKRVPGIVAGYLSVRPRGSGLSWPYIVAGRLPDAVGLAERINASRVTLEEDTRDPS